MTTEQTPPYPFVDRALAQRLERTEASANAAFVESRARLFPDSGACWVDVAGAYAMFDGVDSPLTQTFGLGMFEPVTPAAMDQLEQFFESRSAQVNHEVSPLAHASLALLAERGYSPIELTSVMFRPLTRASLDAAGAGSGVHVEVIDAAHEPVWTETAARGWSEQPEAAAFMATVGRISVAARGSVCFLARLDGRPIAAGGLSIHDGTALLAGASTVPEWRRLGAQLALLYQRLRYAVDQGCTLAMMGAQPGSASQRNAERHGFRIAYTRIKWRRNGRSASAVSG